MTPSTLPALLTPILTFVFSNFITGEEIVSYRFDEGQTLDCPAKRQTWVYKGVSYSVCKVTWEYVESTHPRTLGWLTNIIVHIEVDEISNSE